ncbi:MAG: sigma-70 family RNA polymerase sigma factor [Planctomycetales bacterium]|nr:sigma-70 family RNA polymerase sigma factor [Planctomycetales bacterium]
MKTTNPDDTGLLLDRMQNGDLQACDQLLERHRRRLRKMIQIRLDTRLVARVDPSDIVQDTMAEAAKRLPRFAQERPIPFYAWLRQLAAERLIQVNRQHLKAQGRAVSREVSSDCVDNSRGELIRFLASRSGTPSEILQRKETRRQVQLGIDRLSAIDREVLVLRYVEQLSVQEAAAVLEITVNAFTQRHFRALKRLQSVLHNLRLGELNDE